MNSLTEKIKKHASEADAGWGPAYGLFSKIIERKKLKIGVEIGVAFGGHSETMLKTTTIDKLYGIDPYLHMNGYEDPMNLPQEEFDQLYIFTLERLSSFGDQYQHIRKLSKDAVNDVPAEVDFVYIDADHSYNGVWEDLCNWFPKVLVGGVIGGHDYAHPSCPGVKQAIDEFFRRVEWEIHEEGEGVWWVEKKKLNVSFFIPAYNCATTIEESVESIFNGNFEEGDEIVVTNDGSTDDTKNVLDNLRIEYPFIKLVDHKWNKGGAAARNTAVETAQNSILFCLDSDNLLVPSSIHKLKAYMLNSGADVAAFQELRYFKENKSKITHKWIFRDGLITLADCLSGGITPCASGNYMFTKESWIRAGGYPVSNFLDAWGFGFRQLATGSKMVVMPNSFYFHRYGHESYWVREHKKGKTSLLALQILIPFLDLINDKDVDYIMSSKSRNVWFSNMKNRPIRLKSGEIGKCGKVVYLDENLLRNNQSNIFRSMKNKIKKFIFHVIPNSIKKILNRKNETTPRLRT